MSYLQPPPSPTPSVWIFSGIAHFSTVQKFFHFCNNSKDELKDHPNKKDCCNYSIEEAKGDSWTASAYRTKKTSCLKII